MNVRLCTWCDVCVLYLCRFFCLIVNSLSLCSFCVYVYVFVVVVISRFYSFVLVAPCLLTSIYMYDIQRPFLRKHFRPAVKRNKNEKNSRAPVHTQSMAECEQTNSKWSMKWKKISGWCREWYCGIYVSWGRLNAFRVKNDDNEE